VVARQSLRVPENVSGEFFVDSSCIDCDACRQIAPGTFADSGLGRSFVFRQPQREAERRRAVMALVACPTVSIGTSPKADASPGVSGFPEPIAAGVYYCGFTSASSFGASSYLIQRPEGNVLIDSPRAAGPLLERLELFDEYRGPGIASGHRSVAWHCSFRDPERNRSTTPTRRPTRMPPQFSSIGFWPRKARRSGAEQPISSVCG